MFCHDSKYLFLIYVVFRSWLTSSWPLANGRYLDHRSHVDVKGVVVIHMDLVALPVLALFCFYICT
jgi:hypothetical protein